MTEIEQLQIGFIIGALVATGMILCGIYKTIQEYRKCEAVTSTIGVHIILFSLPVAALTLNISNAKETAKIQLKEIQAIEDILETGNLYYNGKQISADDMTPEQIYSDFSYTITEDSVHVYTK